MFIKGHLNGLNRGTVSILIYFIVLNFILDHLDGLNREIVSILIYFILGHLVELYQETVSIFI